jgi:hypothetical protein
MSISQNERHLKDRGAKCSTTTDDIYIQVLTAHAVEVLFFRVPNVTDWDWEYAKTNKKISTFDVTTYSRSQNQLIDTRRYRRLAGGGMQFNAIMSALPSAGEQIMKLFIIIQLSPASDYFISLWFKYPPWTLSASVQRLTRASGPNTSRNKTICTHLKRRISRKERERKKILKGKIKIIANLNLNFIYSQPSCNTRISKLLALSKYFLPLPYDNTSP